MADDAQGDESRPAVADPVRQRNLSFVMRRLHTQGPLTRSELTSASGLNRSTMLGMVAELQDLELVIEDAAVADGTAGRPSPLVRPHPDILALTVNPDVAGVTCALVGLNGRVVARELVPVDHKVTPDEVGTITGAFVASMAKELPASTRLAGVGIAAPGLVDERDNSVALAPYLEWEDVPLAELIEQATGLPATMANDTSVGVVAESLFGIGVGCDNLLYLNGSTSGVGGGVISDGSLIRGAHGLGTELGHVLLNRNGKHCVCGRVGCLETEVNIRRVWDILGRRVGLNELDHVYANESTPELDADLDDQADALAAGIASLACVFSPELVVLGGHVGALLDARRERIEAEVKRQSFGPLSTGVRLERNHLRERMVPIGAAELAFARVLQQPSFATLTPLADVAGRAA